MRRGMLWCLPVVAGVLLLAATLAPAAPRVLAAGASATAATGAAPGTPTPATPLSDQAGTATSTAWRPDPTVAAKLTATATAYLTPDGAFVAKLVPQLQAAFDRGASQDELVQVTLDTMKGRYRAFGGDVFTLSDRGPIVVHGYWQDGGEWFFTMYLFWRADDGTVGYQSFDQSYSLLGSAFFCPPEAMWISHGPNPEIGMVVCPGVMGQDWGGGYYLLRLEGGAWRLVWDYTRAQHAGLWATRLARAYIMPGDAVLLLGAVPEADAVPRFFNESEHHAEQQEFLSLWRRAGDEYVRVSGQLVETPMTALTEFMLGLHEEGQAAALARAADPEVVDRALAKGWGTLIGSSLMAWSEDWSTGVEQTLVFGPPDTWGNLYEAPYRADLVLRDGRWLVAAVEAVRPGTLRPFTPEPTGTAEATLAQ